MVALEPGGLVGHHGVAHGVGLVKGVVGEVVDLLVDGLRRDLWDAVSHAAGNIPLRIAMDEGVFLLLNLLGLLLGDGPAHHVGLAQGIAAQLLKDLDHLLLIDDTAVGDGQDRNQGGMLIPDQLGIMLAGDESGNGIHGTRAVEGDDSGNIFDILRLEPHAYARHAR